MNIHIRKILCATDFSPFSAVAMDTAQKLAAVFDAHLTVFHSVFHPRHQPYDVSILDQRGQNHAESATAHAKITDMMTGSRINWDPLVILGDPVTSVLEAIDQMQIDLVVAASHGLSGFKRFVLGKIVDRIAGQSPCPVLVVKTNRRWTRRNQIPEFCLDNILIGCDLYPGSGELMKYGGLFSRYFDAHMHVVHAVASPLNEEIVSSTQGPYFRVQEALRERLFERVISLAAQECLEASRCDYDVSPGMPSDILLSTAKRLSPDLVILGRRMKKRLEKYLVGSTIQPLLHHARGSLLLVPLQDA